MQKNISQIDPFLSRWVKFVNFIDSLWLININDLDENYLRKKEQKET